MTPKARKALRRISLRILLILGGFYLLFAAAGYAFSDRLIFFPQPSSYKDASGALKLDTSDGARIAALYLPNPTAAYTVLYSHGNAEDLGDIAQLLEEYQRRGFAILAYDYHGYGASAGKPGVENSYRDIDAAYDYLTTTLQIPPERVIVHGRSVGSGPSTYLASRKPVGGLIIESGFVSAFRVVTRHAILPCDKYPNLSRIKKVNCPVLVMHGRCDRVIPFWHGEKLFAAAGEPKQSLWVDNADHNDLADTAGETYWLALQSFAAEKVGAGKNARP